MTVKFHDIGRLPAPQDNCAIAIGSLDAGTTIEDGSSRYTLSHAILVGHRFAVAPIAAGVPLLSWGLPFGRALRDIAPGEYVCNERILTALNGRHLPFELPAEPNFADDLAAYHFDPATFQPAAPLPVWEEAPMFMGYERPGKRGVGTRNTIVLLGVNAIVGGFVKQLESQLKPLLESYPHIDGIVAVNHTEGSRADNNNQELLLRTLAGWMVHPNVGAVLVLDAGEVGVTNEMVGQYAAQNDIPLAELPHAFVSLRGPLAEDVARCEAIVKSWLPQVNGLHRTPQALSELKIALQCGGSDAFSGISGNPLAALVAKWVIQAGGAAVLAETDELLGAESYVLQKVRNAGTVERFLGMLERFQERMAWHGHSAHLNPSGGNLYRGLYNIYLKSLGAATKRDPEVPLDGVLEYGERLSAPGYYFMDSPGNDLESIAGQVASGCNMIYFVTGNGSITNFPFVPTIKIVTTTARYELLSKEMDVNAGAFLDGTPLADVGRETLDLTVAVAGGRRSVGENAHHAQVQIWRNWHLDGRIPLNQIVEPAFYDGRPIPVTSPGQPRDISFQGWQTAAGTVTDRVGLILPSSLCSGQIAQMAAERLNQAGIGRGQQISRFVALVHTEGCGASTQAEYVDTLLGYLAHPQVATCLVLEHGCEITHNDFWRSRMDAVGLDPAAFGWASVQLDGGIDKVLARIEQWFMADCAALAQPLPTTTGLAELQLGILSDGVTDEATAVALAELVGHVSAAGGTVIMPVNDELLAQEEFSAALAIPSESEPTLGYAHRAEQRGFYLMANPAAHWLETLTGLGATGVDLILAPVSTRPQTRHPFIPVVQLAGANVNSALKPDLDLVLAGQPAAQLEQLLGHMAAVLSNPVDGRRKLVENVGFQITRGLFGVSL